MFSMEILSAIGLCFRLYFLHRTIAKGTRSHEEKNYCEDFYVEKNEAVLSHGEPGRAERELGVSGSEGGTCAAAGSCLKLAAGISVFQVPQPKLLLS